MNGRTAKLIRKFAKLQGNTAKRRIRSMKRSYNELSHIGKTIVRKIMKDATSK